MDTTAWERAKTAFWGALQATGPERARVVAELCGDDPDLRARVELLLAAHDEAGDFMAQVTAASDLAVRDTLPEDAEERFMALQSAVAGRYSLERELGRGGMGIVYLARDVSLDRPVAIKLLSSEVGRRIDARERFLHEARTSAGLCHPNVVPVHAVEERAGLVFFVMTFIDGETVRERVRRTGPMSVTDASRMLQEVAWALGCAHRQGVVHRDIKPDNIILETGGGRAVVTDFGIARTDALSPGAGNGLLLGTPDFVSPEQRLGGDVDGRSDLYSLGVTCFFALTGRLPFEEQSSAAASEDRLDLPAPSVAVLRPDVPPRLAHAIGRCLARDPEDRFASADELAEAVSEARPQVVTVPAPVRDVHRAAELLVMDGLGWGAISAILFVDWLLLGDDPTLEWGIKIGVYVVGIGLVAGRALNLVRAVRAAIARGFGVHHLRSALSVGAGEESAPGAEVGGVRAFTEASALLSFLVLVGVGFMFAFWDGDNPARGWLRPWYFFTLMAWNTALVMVPVFVGRSLCAMAIGRWKATRRLWARLWHGRVGQSVFRLAGIGFGGRARAQPALQPTQTLVAGAALELFDSLPADYRRRLGDLPGALAHLESAANALRRRESQLERASAQVGTVGTRVDRWLGHGESEGHSATYEGVQAHRAKAAEDLGAARAAVGARLSETIAALENVRLGLLRLHAGVGTPDDLTQGLTVARKIGREVQSLLDGQRDVEALLSRRSREDGPARRAIGEAEAGPDTPPPGRRAVDGATS